MYPWLKLAALTPTETAMLGGVFGPLGATAGGAYASDAGKRLQGGLAAGAGSLAGGAISAYTLTPLLALGGGVGGALLGKALGQDDGAVLGAGVGSGLGTLAGLSLGSALGAGGGYDLGMPKKAEYIPESARGVVKQAYNELAQMTVAQLPYLMPETVRQQQSERGLPLPAVAAIGAGLTGMHLAGDTPTIGNKLRRTINNTLGTDFDTESRAAAVLKALR